jgi:hypothetical protein
MRSGAWARRALNEAGVSARVAVCADPFTGTDHAASATHNHSLGQQGTLQRSGTRLDHFSFVRCVRLQPDSPRSACTPWVQ